MYAEKNTELYLEKENEKSKTDKSFNRIDTNADPFNDIYNHHIDEEQPVNKTDLFTKQYKHEVSMLSQNNNNKSHFIKKPLS